MAYLHATSLQLRRDTTGAHDSFQQDRWIGKFPEIGSTLVHSEGASRNAVCGEERFARLHPLTVLLVCHLRVHPVLQQQAGHPRLPCHNARPSVVCTAPDFKQILTALVRCSNSGFLSPPYL